MDRRRALVHLDHGRSRQSAHGSSDAPLCPVPRIRVFGIRDRKQRWHHSPPVWHQHGADAKRRELWCAGSQGRWCNASHPQLGLQSCHLAYAGCSKQLARDTGVTSQSYSYERAWRGVGRFVCVACGHLGRHGVGELELSYGDAGAPTRGGWRWWLCWYEPRC